VNSRANEALKYARQAAGLDAIVIDGNMQFIDIVDRSGAALRWALLALDYDINHAKEIAQRAQLDGSIVRTANLIIRALTVGAAVHKAAA
jgi:hypothetical protein